MGLVSCKRRIRALLIHVRTPLSYSLDGVQCFDIISGIEPKSLRGKLGRHSVDLITHDPQDHDVQFVMHNSGDFRGLAHSHMSRLIFNFCVLNKVLI